MGKIVRKTSEEIRKEWSPERVSAYVNRKGIPSFDPGFTDEDYATGRVVHICRGLDKFQEYLKKTQNQKGKKSKVS